MKLARILSSALIGLDAVLVEVEVDASFAEERTALVTVGLPDTAVRESKDRVLTAIKNSGFKLGCITCTVNLAPGDLRKEGPLYDLPIALGLLCSLEYLPKASFHEQYLIIGELGLGGDLRPIPGALAIAMLAKKMGKKGVLLPSLNAKEAASVPGIDVIPVSHLQEAIAFFRDQTAISPLQPNFSNALPSVTAAVDFADVKGQLHAKRALEIAAAGGHNIVLSGPPGTGKTLMAKALMGIMPDMTIEEAIEVTKIYSVAGMLPEGHSLITQRPFRSPHHTISYAGLVGGGAVPRPGEVALAHNGILFLDELPEFSRSVLEVLRQPLEDKKVTISRANGHFTFPTNFLCLAAMNPCPCGMLGHPDKMCRDSKTQIDRYRGKISEPLWDRLDMHIEVPALRYQEIVQAAKGESSAQVKMRVIAARKKQQERLGGLRTNSLMTSGELREWVPLDSTSQAIIKHAIEVMGLSARACDKLLRVSRTIADIANAPHVETDHLMEALAFRQDR